MKRSVYFQIAVIAMAFTAANLAASQSPTPLGDYARAAKKAKASTAAKESAKVYDNDNLPRTTSISVVGETSPNANADQNSASAEKNPDGTPKQDAEASDKKKGPEIKLGQSAEERQKALDAWKDKLAGEQEKISKLSHDLDLAKREYDIKAAEFYANTAERTQNPNAFREQDDKYKQEIADKQKLVDGEKAKLSEMQDDARKAGAPNSVIEGDSGANQN